MQCLSAGDSRCSSLPGQLAASLVRSALPHCHDEGPRQQFLLLGHFLHHMDDHFSHGKGFKLFIFKSFFCITKIRVVFKLFPVVFVSIANISSFLQVAFMFDMTAVTEKMDSQILKGCLIITILQTVIPLVTEYTLVNVDNLTNLIDHNVFTDDDRHCSSDDPGKYCYLLWW